MRTLMISASALAMSMAIGGVAHAQGSCAPGSTGWNDATCDLGPDLLGPALEGGGDGCGDGCGDGGGDGCGDGCGDSSASVDHDADEWIYMDDLDDSALA